MQVLVTNSVYFAADGPVVEWDEDCSNVRAGPNAIHYEAARKDCGAHLLYNAFWKLKNFCVQQMLPRDIIHAIDLGTIVRLILAILMKYFECVEKILGMEGLAASRMGARLLILHIIWHILQIDFAYYAYYAYTIAYWLHIILHIILHI
jgi:hypothetical protein